MKAFLDFLEKILTWFFSLSFGALVIFGVYRYQHHQERAKDPWLIAQRENTQESYAAFLRQCQGCPKEEEARRALDDLQQGQGLLARLSSEHLPKGSMISLPSFSKDGQIILATSGRGPEFWETETGHRSDYGEGLFGRSKSKVRIDNMALAPDGRRIGAGSGGDEGGKLLMWELDSERKISEQPVDGFDVKAVIFSPDSIWLGWRGEGPVGLWNPAAGRFYRGNHDGVKSIAFLNASDGKQFFVSAGDHELWLWSTDEMALIRQGGLNSDRPHLGLSHDGLVAVHSDGRVLEVFDTETRALLGELRDLDGDILRFCRDSDSGRLVVGTRSGFLYLWDPRTSPMPMAKVAAHEGPIEDLACGSQGRVVSIGWEAAKIWSLEKMANAASSSSKEQGRKNIH